MVATEYRGIYFYCKTNSRPLIFNRILEKKKKIVHYDRERKNRSQLWPMFLLI